MQSIFKFHPIYKERPWGGQAISKIASHSLPAGKKIGESWEISDRPGDESVIAEGPFQGKTIRWLLQEYGPSIMGRPWPESRRFPLLIKLLDASERLSLQVHPPPQVAAELGGEPKAEMWYLLQAEPGAAVMAGLKKGISREDFEKALRAQTLESMVHSFQVQKGDTIVIPSGRIHAIDAGCLILEIQQNSDTTYRVYDWGRAGLDGKPRDLHVKESLRSIDFSDFEPGPQHLRSLQAGGMVSTPYFQTDFWSLDRPRRLHRNVPAVIHAVSGGFRAVSSKGEVQTVREGETVLVVCIGHEISPLDGKTGLIIAHCVL